VVKILPLILDLTVSVTFRGWTVNEIRSAPLFPVAAAVAAVRRLLSGVAVENSLLAPRALAATQTMAGVCRLSVPRMASPRRRAFSPAGKGVKPPPSPLL
jgi:hypothetical protein